MRRRRRLATPAASPSVLSRPGIVITRRVKVGFYLHRLARVHLSLSWWHIVATNDAQHGWQKPDPMCPSYNANQAENLKEYFEDKRISERKNDHGEEGREDRVPHARAETGQRFYCAVRT